MTEYSLHGHIADALKPKLYDRLIGICGREPINIFEIEMGFVPTVRTPVGPERNEDMLLRLKSPLDEKDLTKRQWQLCQIAPPVTRTHKAVTVRPVIYSRISQGEPFKFLSALGYSFAFQFIKKGITFIYGRNVKISITRIYQLESLNDPNFAKPFDPQNLWIVEVTAMINTGEDAVDPEETLGKLSSMLIGVLDLHHVDHLHLQNKINYA
ncbi:hypothetical protein G9A89_015007 [Geosiphon pyriformis]|nr:hypothetical protein G9A89_015007 [Geosiphon pyriformis]